MEKKDFCCEDMRYSTTDDRKLIKYDSSTRDYLMILHNVEHGDYLEIDYCPWCGTKLPSSLNEEWCKAVKEEFGYEDVFAEEWERLPEEFKTDEWWKKRGL